MYVNHDRIFEYLKKTTNTWTFSGIVVVSSVMVPSTTLFEPEDAMLFFVNLNVRELWAKCSHTARTEVTFLDRAKSQ